MKHPCLLFQIAILLAAGADTLAPAAEPAPSARSDIEYSTLEEALSALHAKAGVKFKNQDGWLVADDTDAIVIWLFTLPGHPAYPTMIKRHIVNGHDGAYMDTAVRCLASQAVCDRYFGDK